MRYINTTNKNSFSLYSQQKRSPIEYYLQKIKYIKNQPNTFNQENRKDPHFHTYTNLTQSLIETKTNQYTLQEKKKNYEKKRSLSMKTEIQFSGKSELNKFNARTQYGNNKFQTTHYNKSTNFISNQDSKTKLKTVSSFKTKPESRNLFRHSKFSLTRNRIVTEPSQISHNFTNKNKSIQSQHQKNEPSTNTQRAERVKENIFDKISSYVQNLDQKGEQQLNQMLVGNYKKHIKCHTDVIVYEDKIKSMINTNKEIVKMLKQQLLSPSRKRRLSQYRDPTSFQNKGEKLPLSPQKTIIVDELEVNLQSSHVKTKPQNHCKLATLQDSQPLSQIEHLKSSQQLDGQQPDEQFDYQDDINHVTNEFVNQWQRSKVHKKELYQKFRKTLFKKFPQFRQRQQRLNEQNGNLKTKLQKSQEDDDIFDNKFPIELLNKKMQNEEKEKFETRTKIKHEVSSSSAHKLNQHQLGKVNLPNKIDEPQQLKTTTNKFSQSLSKITCLSKKNSMSKNSTRTLSILSTQNKQQVAKFNFESLVEFIFKRAYFYSVSKKRVIQNKTECTKLQIVPPVDNQKSTISFVTYNSKAHEKKNLRTSKLNEKKLRATGNFLIKNKYNIMGLQQEGHKSYDFLRTCLEDAIEDYLNGAKSK